jgi:hypothetical protein
MHEATLAPEGLYTTAIPAPEISAMQSVLRLSILIEMSKQNRISEVTIAVPKQKEFHDGETI